LRGRLIPQHSLSRRRSNRNHQHERRLAGGRVCKKPAPFPHRVNGVRLPIIAAISLSLFIKGCSVEKQASRTIRGISRSASHFAIGFRRSRGDVCVNIALINKYGIGFDNEGPGDLTACRGITVVYRRGSAFRSLNLKP
jgi:hypothetical protein